MLCTASLPVGIFTLPRRNAAVSGGIQLDPDYTLPVKETGRPAVAMGVASEVGTVTEGKYADIIAVRGDVLRYITRLRDVDLVIKHGVRVR